MTDGYQMFEGQLSIDSFKPVRTQFYCQHIIFERIVPYDCQFKCNKYGHQWGGSIFDMKKGCENCENHGNCLDCRHQINPKYNIVCGECEQL